MVDAVGTTHHVKIGGTFFNVRPGSFRKRAAPSFGARFATGDPDYNNLSFWQHWAQTCWVGGLDAKTWVDDSMYYKGVGIDSSKHEVLTMSRDLGPIGATRTTDHWTVGGAVSKREFVVFNDTLYCLTIATTAANCQLWEFDDSTQVWTSIKTFGDLVHSICAWGSELWVGMAGTDLWKMDTAGTWSSHAKPAGRTEMPWAMCVFRDRMYVGFGQHIWRMKPDDTWDGTTEFFNAIGVNIITHMEPHLGFLYMGTYNGHILRTDGNATFDLWSWDGGVTITGMRSYDGRLFVGTVETEPGTDAGSGVLYQFTGAAVTELKRWGQRGRGSSPGKMRVAFRKLFYGASDLLGMQSGFGIAVYDAAEDAHSIFASDRDGSTYPAGTAAVNLQVDDVIYWGTDLFCSVRGYGVFRTGLYHDDGDRGVVTGSRSGFDFSANGASALPFGGGWVESSDFDAGTPGLQKLWRQILIHADLPSSTCTIVVEYSLDGGGTWTTAGTVTKTGSATRYDTAFPLENVRGTRFKYRLTLRSTTASNAPSVLGVVVAYLPQPEPNWQWEMTLELAEKSKKLDETDEDMSTEVVLAALEAQWRTQQLINFVEPNGTSWASGGSPGVLISDLQIDIPYIAPDDEGPLEALVRIVLLEAVENF